MSCEYCNIPKNTCGKLILEEADELGVYLYRDKSGNYFLTQNMLDVTKERIITCPMCGEPLTEPKPLTLDELRKMDGKPVWCVAENKNLVDGSGWHIVNSTEEELIDKHKSYWRFDQLIEDYQCYDREPKEEGQCQI